MKNSRSRSLNALAALHLIRTAFAYFLDKNLTLQIDIKLNHLNYRHMYFWMHFAMLAAVLVLPKILPPPKTPKWTTTNPTPASLATN